MTMPPTPSPPDLRTAAQRVLDRWDSPRWKWGDGPTGELMDDMRAALAAPQPTQEPCRWTQEDEDSGTFWTGCNKGFAFTDGTPEDNGFPYCCYCGKPLTQVLWTEPADDEEPTFPQPRRTDDD